MKIALDEARAAAAEGEVPVGAVLVRDGAEVARGHNRTIAAVDPSSHAEIETLRLASVRLGNHRTGGVLYVTLEPCLMCMGALVQARVELLVYGADDPKAGAAASLFRIAEDVRLNHRFAVRGGVAAEECSALLSGFFQARRDCRSH